MRSLMRRAAPLRYWLSLFAIAAIAGCGRAVTDPSGQEDIYLRADIDRAVVERGGVATVTFRLASVAATAVTLHFNSGCQIMPYIAEAASGTVVHPEGGSWVCTTAITTLELPPAASVTRVLRVQATGSGGNADVALPPGEYVTYARLEDREYQLVSTSVSFTLR